MRPIPNAFIINIGDMLSKITNHTLKATLHQVLDIGVDRYSSPFFLEPHYTAKIPQTIMGETSESDPEGVAYGEYLIRKISKTYLSYRSLE